MRCDEVRPLLPELAEGTPRLAGPVEHHLATCAACTRELGRYRSLITELAALREEVVEPPEGFLGRVLTEMPEPGIRLRLARVASDRRVRRVALPVSGAVVGAAAVGLLWWRVTHRHPAEGLTSAAR